MTSENKITADNNSNDIGPLVAHLTLIVERETAAFQKLLDVLLEQQSSIVKGDSESVNETNEKVVQIMAETRVLTKERYEETHSIEKFLDVEIEESMNLMKLIPLVEGKYAKRLTELREILNMLLLKINKTSKQNSGLLDNSLKFVDQCMKHLVESQNSSTAYGPNGEIGSKEKSLFSGVG